MVIDVFSKYGWIVPLKSKTGVDVANALNKIFHERKCQKICVDKGLEFYNKHVKALDVELYSTENEVKSCVVERWNRTIKDKMFKYFSANFTRKYIDVLDEMVNKYNNTKHFSIKMTPVEASDKKNENIVWFNLNRNVRSKSVRPKFSIGDRIYHMMDLCDIEEQILINEYLFEVFFSHSITGTDLNIYFVYLTWKTDCNLLIRNCSNSNTTGNMFNDNSEIEMDNIRLEEVINVNANRQFENS
ncbi:uncharacterized protein LOC136076018 [Hydra vulgaris]|uniref:Uncharacterized protein LOC136076018 n=1 Tax=Hydra vulgaris TaxID=6087 RepID=A0ABM4B9I5_HYDVU